QIATLHHGAKTFHAQYQSPTAVAELERQIHRERDRGAVSFPECSSDIVLPRGHFYAEAEGDVAARLQRFRVSQPVTREDGHLPDTRRGISVPLPVRVRILETSP